MNNDDITHTVYASCRGDASVWRPARSLSQARAIGRELVAEGWPRVSIRARHTSDGTEWFRGGECGGRLVSAYEGGRWEDK